MSATSISAETLQQARFLEVDAGVRYWEDAELNGVEDTHGAIALRQGARWKPVIDLASGQVLNWPAGMHAKVHYKVCDNGDYWLLDAAHKRVAKWVSSYVPDSILCTDGSGFGDYIVLTIDTNGMVQDWEPPRLRQEQWERV